MRESLKVILFNSFPLVAGFCLVGAFWYPTLLEIPVYQWMALVRFGKE